MAQSYIRRHSVDGALFAYLQEIHSCAFKKVAKTSAPGLGGERVSTAQPRGALHKQLGVAAELLSISFRANEIIIDSLSTLIELKRSI